METPFFVIISLSRCGSTAVHRALNCHDGIRCGFEPDFSDLNWRNSAVVSRMHELRQKYSGIKHVWDPSGWPFAGVHASSIAEMDRRIEDVRALNIAIMQCADRVVHLRRRDRLDRVLSDLLGQQTELWGPAYSDGRISEVDEVVRYRAELEVRPVRAIDPEIVDWYLTHVPPLEDEFATISDDGHYMELEYEELFGPSVVLEDRLNGYCRILEFLGFSTAPESWNKSVVEKLFHPRAKLNDASTVGRIPNLAELRRRFPNNRD